MVGQGPLSDGDGQFVALLRSGCAVVLPMDLSCKASKTFTANWLTAI